jgi:hypothetical protein
MKAKTVLCRRATGREARETQCRAAKRKPQAAMQSYVACI